MTRKMEGIIIKALSGFYYVHTGSETIACRARGRFRLDGTSPLVGDRVRLDASDGRGTVIEVLPRRNRFIRPAVANVDQLVIVAANVNPVTDPFLIDRVTAIAEMSDCDAVICLNKCDLDPADELYDVYSASGFRVIRTSAVTMEGIDELRAALAGKISAFTGNSGVGKSSLLNALEPGLGIETGEVSEKLGRGRHTTRHVEFFRCGEGGYAADTPGFASFDIEHTDPILKDMLQFAFREFAPYIGSCRFNDCAHLREPDCAVLAALERGEIKKSRHDSYARLYALSAQLKEWELEN